MNLVFLGVMAYVALQLAVGFLVTPRVKDEEDYLLAGRRLGLGIGTMTVFATWFGAETCIGAAGAVYTDGLAGSRADPFGYALCILCMGVFFAAAFWRMKLTTPGDFFRERYGVVVEKMAVFLMVPTSLLWGAAQIRAFGQVIAATSEFNVEFGIVIAALVVVTYTCMGGLWADSITDVIQGIVLIAGLLIIGVAVGIDHAGDPGIRDAFTAERLSLSAPGEPWFARLEAWSIPIMGSLVAQELISRMLASKSPSVARNACFAASGLYLAIGLIPVVLGLMGPALVPNLEDPEHLLPALAEKYLSPFLYVIFAGGLISAILSTVDSNLLASASLVSHNVIVPLAKNPTEKYRVRAARIMVVIFGGIAYIMATRAESVYGLVEEASAFGSSGLFVSVAFGIFLNRGGAYAAGASLLAGVGTYVTVSILLEGPYPFLCSLAASAIAFLAVAAFEEPSESARRLLVACRQTGPVAQQS